MAEERDRNDPELKYLSVERNAFNDPATQAEWTQKRLVWVPHENQVRGKNTPFHQNSGCPASEFFIFRPGIWLAVVEYTQHCLRIKLSLSMKAVKIVKKSLKEVNFCLQPTINS
jgi:hypothetical protein